MDSGRAAISGMNELLYDSDVSPLALLFLWMICFEFNVLLYYIHLCLRCVVSCVQCSTTVV